MAEVDLLDVVRICKRLAKQALGKDKASTSRRLARISSKAC